MLPWEDCASGTVAYKEAFLASQDFGWRKFNCRTTLRQCYLGSEGKTVDIRNSRRRREVWELRGSKSAIAKWQVEWDQLRLRHNLRVDVARDQDERGVAAKYCTDQPNKCCLVMVDPFVLRLRFWDRCIGISRRRNDILQHNCSYLQRYCDCCSTKTLVDGE